MMESSGEDIRRLCDEAKANLATIDRKKLSVDNSFMRWKGGKIIMRLKQMAFIQRICCFLRIDYLYHRFSKAYDAEIEKSFKDYLKPEELSDVKLRAELKKDIKCCDKLIMAKPYEYFFLSLRNKSTKERMQFVTDKYMLQTMSIHDCRTIHDVELNDKYNFYLLAKPFFKRRVVRIDSETNRKEFINISKFIVSGGGNSMIFKPIHLGCGSGIFVGDISTPDKANELFSRLIDAGGGWIAEELIKQTYYMAQWNKTSVNTVRLLSFSTSNGICFTTSFIRTGREGAVVDNGGAGGIFAAIDEKTGVIITDGMDELANSYVEHPDSHVKFKGWKIPRWKELLETASALHSTVFPNIKYVGWDFALTDQGWVVIEGNWGQFIHQAATGIGLRPIFDKYIGLKK